MTDLERLLADLNDPDWLVRANAAEALGKMAGLPEWQENSKIAPQHLTNALMHTLDFTEDELIINYPRSKLRSFTLALRPKAYPSSWLVYLQQPCQQYCWQHSHQPGQRVHTVCKGK